MNRARLLSVLTLILLLVLLVVVLSVVFKLSSFSREFNKRTVSIENGLDDHTKSLGILKTLFAELAADVNETRGVLLLPEKQYDFGSDYVEMNGNENNLAFFQGLDTILSRKQNNETLSFFNSFVESIEFREIVQKLSLVLSSSTEESRRFFRDGKPSFTVEAAGPHHVSLVSATGYELSAAGFSNEVADFFEKSVEDADRHFRIHDSMVQELQGLLKSEDLSTLIAERGLVLVYPLEEAEKTAGQLTTREGRVVLRFGITRDTNSIILDTRDINSVQFFKEAFKEALATVDTRTEEEIRVDRGKERVLALRQDAGFITYLESKDLFLSEDPREDSDYFYYDLRRTDGTTLGSFAVQKMLGEIYLMDEDDVPIASLKKGGFSPPDEKKN